MGCGGWLLSDGGWGWRLKGWVGGGRGRSMMHESEGDTALIFFESSNHGRIKIARIGICLH